MECQAFPGSMCREVSRFQVINARRYWIPSVSLKNLGRQGGKGFEKPETTFSFSDFKQNTNFKGFSSFPCSPTTLAMIDKSYTALL